MSLGGVPPGKLAVDLVGGDVDEAPDPRVQGRLEEGPRAQDVGAHEGRIRLDGAVHVGLGRQVEDDLVSGEDPGHGLAITDVGVHESVAPGELRGVVDVG